MKHMDVFDILEDIQNTDTADAGVPAGFELSDFAAFDGLDETVQHELDGLDDPDAIAQDELGDIKDPDELLSEDPVAFDDPADVVQNGPDEFDGLDDAERLDELVDPAELVESELDGSEPDKGELGRFGGMDGPTADE
jgi:hypothetical protein